MRGASKGERRGGRQKGTPNKRKAAVKAAAAKVATVLPDAFDGDAHALLMLVYKNPLIDLAVRMDAAKAALPFEKSRMAPVEPQRIADDHIPLAERLRSYTRNNAIEASKGRAVELPKKGTAH